MPTPKDQSDCRSSVSLPRRDTGVHTWLVLWKASQSILEIARRDIKERGLGESDFGVLEVLFHKGTLPVNAIGKRVFLTSGSMTAAIHRLESKGFLIRNQDPNDHRTWLVSLTNAGRKWIESAFQQHAQLMEQVFAPLSAAERRQLTGMLKRVGKPLVGTPEE